MRRLFCILLLICLPLQSFASQVAGLQTLKVSGMFHEAERLTEMHHHDDHGSVHYDDSDESAAHADEHSAVVQVSLLNRSNLAFEVSLFSLVDFPDPASYVPKPFLDDPQRPPAFAPGLATGG